MRVPGSGQTLTELGFQAQPAISAANPAAWLNAAQVAGIRRLSRDDAFKQRELADGFAATQSLISSIVNDRIRLDQPTDSVRQASEA